MTNTPYNEPSSANPEELEFFRQISAEWWDPNGKFKPLHRFNPARIEFLMDAICNHFSLEKSSQGKSDIFSQISILDVGCGGGLIAEPLARLGAKVTGIDLLEENIKVAQAHAHDSNLSIDYQVIPVENLDPSLKFDVILHMDVLEHVNNRLDFIKASSSFMKEDGLYLASTLNRTSKSLVFGKVMAEYLLNWLAHGTHDWKKFIKPRELNADLEKSTLKIEKMSGISYNVLTQEWTLSDDISINYIISAIKR